MNSNHILGWNSHFWSVLCLVLLDFLVLSLRPIKTQKCNLIRQHFKNFTFFLIAKTKLEHYVFLSKLKLSTWFLAWEDKWIIFFQAVDHGQGPLFYKIYYKLWEWWRREICIFAQLSQLRAIPHPCIHTHGFSRTHINEGQFWAGANPWGLPVLVLKKQLLHTVAENTVLPLVSLAFHTIPRVHFWVLFES